eukprot:139772-Pleurochrysis_carterae.AAC.1
MGAATPSPYHLRACDCACGNRTGRMRVLDRRPSPAAPSRPRSPAAGHSSRRALPSVPRMPPLLWA